MSLTRNEIYVKALLEGYEELQEKKYSGKWHLADEMMDLQRAIELADLTLKQRQVLNEIFVKQNDQYKAAEVLGVSQPMVFKHLTYAVKKIASIYEQWEALEYAE
jgi:DNA-directed RNA polymerase specialized sigma subunit